MKKVNTIAGKWDLAVGFKQECAIRKHVVGGSHKKKFPISTQVEHSISALISSFLLS